MNALITRDNVRELTLEEGHYVAVEKSGRTPGSQERSRRYMAFAQLTDITQVMNKSYETHVVIKNYGNYIGTYNLDVGARDTIQKADLITKDRMIKVLKKVHGGKEIMDILDETEKKVIPNTKTPTLLNLIHEEIDKDKFFIAIEYYSPHTGQLVLGDEVVVPKDIRRACGIIGKKELDYFINKYENIVTKRTGI